jgi:hypothetical protein
VIPVHERSVDVVTFTGHRNFLNLTLSPEKQRMLVDIKRVPEMIRLQFPTEIV